MFPFCFYVNKKYLTVTKIRRLLLPLKLFLPTTVLISQQHFYTPVNLHLCRWDIHCAVGIISFRVGKSQRTFVLRAIILRIENKGKMREKQEIIKNSKNFLWNIFRTRSIQEKNLYLCALIRRILNYYSKQNTAGVCISRNTFNADRDIFRSLTKKAAEIFAIPVYFIKHTHTHTHIITT